jgi:Virus neck protein
MATNFFFNNFKSAQEQDLLESLVVESIKIYGEDMYYVPRNVNNLDQLYTADDQSSYTQAFMVELYIKSVDGFGGDGNFMSKFGLEIRDQVVFSIAQRTFNREIGMYIPLTRPREGDIVFFPLNNKCFQIKYVNKFEMFYQLGALQTWELTCELFEYSDELFNTGIPEIDALQTRMGTNILDHVLVTDQSDYIATEDESYLVPENYSVDDNLDTVAGTGTNQVFQGESDNFIDFSVKDPFSEGHL